MTHNFNPGTLFTNNQIVKTFNVNDSGRIRYSSVTNSIVVISDYTQSLYKDKWIENTLLYTGDGESGDQSLDKIENQMLINSKNSNSKRECEVFSVNYNSL